MNEQQEQIRAQLDVLRAGFAKFMLMDERRFELEKMGLESRRGENINSS